MRPAVLAAACLLLSCGKGASREPGGSAPEGDGTLRGTAPPLTPASTGEVAPAAEAAAGAGPGEAPAADECAALPRQTCLESPACTLVHEPQGARRALYRCRAAEPPCETIVPQSAFSGEGRDAARRQCEGRAECVFQDADCYCPCRGSGQTSVPDGPEARSCNCVCGGGAPARCRVRQ